MKEAIAWHYHGLFVMGLIGVGWLVLLVVAVLKTSKLEIVSRGAIITIIALSLPAYIGYGYWYSQNSPNSLMGNAKLNIALATEQAELYRKQCSIIPAIEIRKTFESEIPADLRIEEPPPKKLGYALYPARPWTPATSVCWMDQASNSCPSANIRYVEYSGWFYADQTTSCDPYPGEVPRAKCSLHSFRHDRTTQTRVSVPKFESRYVLSVAEPQRVGSHVLRYAVSVKDRESGEILGHTHLHSRDSFGVRPLSNEPPHCPPRDAHIAVLLSRVFPVKQNSASR